MGNSEYDLLDKYLVTLLTPPYTPEQKSQAIHLYAAKNFNPVNAADVNIYLGHRRLPTIPS
jgi:hypothetical protein